MLHLENAVRTKILPVAQMPITVKNVTKLRNTKKSTPALPRIAVLAYEGLCTFEFGIAVELFGLPRPELERWYAFEVCGLEKGPLRATGGVSVMPRIGLSGLLHADTILIPGWRNPDEPPPPPLPSSICMSLTLISVV